MEINPFAPPQTVCVRPQYHDTHRLGLWTLHTLFFFLLGVAQVVFALNLYWFSKVFFTGCLMAMFSTIAIIKLRKNYPWLHAPWIGTQHVLLVAGWIIPFATSRSILYPQYPGLNARLTIFSLLWAATALEVAVITLLRIIYILWKRRTV